MGGVKTAWVPHTIFCLGSKPSNTKQGIHHFQECVNVSVVGVFNKVQRVAGRGTCSNGVPLPKLAIYPHQADYCDTCAWIKVQINGMRQSGCVTEEEQRKIEQDIITTEEELATYWEHVSKAREYHNDMTAWCMEQWEKLNSFLGQNRHHL